MFDQIAARRFVLVDEEGNPMAYLTGSEAGMVGLHVKGAEEEGPMASIGIDSRYGRPVVRLHRPEGGEIIISVMESGRAAINLVDEDGTERIVATSGDDFGEHFN